MDFEKLNEVDLFLDRKNKISKLYLEFIYIDPGVTQSKQINRVRCGTIPQVKNVRLKVSPAFHKFSCMQVLLKMRREISLSRNKD